MFPQLRNNESGMVLVMVLMVVVIMMVYSIGVVTRGTSQQKSVEDQIDSIKSEQLSIGAYAKAYTDLASGSALPTNVDGVISMTMDNKIYVTNVYNPDLDVGNGSIPRGPDGTWNLRFTTPY